MKKICVLFYLVCVSVVGKPCLLDVSKLVEKEQNKGSIFYCEKDSDCVLVKEACRSCTDYQVSVHKDSLEKFNTLENDFRAKERCVRSCEACTQQHFRAVCKNNTCTVKKMELDSPKQD
jgi:hypothetical protein